MDPSSVITQVSQDDDASQLFSPKKVSKKRSSFLCSIICCLGKRSSKFKSSKDGSAAAGCSLVDGAPASEKATPYKGKFLLPDPKPEDVNKKCIVIDLDETLVHSSFKPINNADFIVPVEIDNVIHQVYVLKRPYVDEFLCKVGELFECVLFTASLAKYADPVADLLDKWDVFHCRLFRESCVFHRGNYVKDLGRLGRELHNIIIVDNSPASYIFHPDNAVPVASWFDDINDRELLDLIPFLENLSKVESVYTILQQAKDGNNSSNNKAAGNNSILPLPVTVAALQTSSSPISSVTQENNSASLKKNNNPITAVTQQNNST